MTARNLLWLVLGVVGVPLLIEGGNGCGFQSQPFPSTPIDDNAYTCACSCDAAPVTKTVTIAANTDDAEQDGANVRLGGNDLHIGPDFVGLRFVNVGLPKDAMIVSAAVQFTASATDIDPATVAIVAQADSNAATFSNTDNDISNRPPTVDSVPWSPGPWNNNEKGPTELTPDLSPLLTDLVGQANWSGKSPVVLIFRPGTGQRRAVSFSNDPAHAAVLQVTFTAPIGFDVPVCATPDIVAQNVKGVLPQAVADADCHGRVTDNLKALGAACGYPTAACTCSLNIPDQGDPTFDRDVCKNDCKADPVDPTCSNFDPNGFAACLNLPGATVDGCAHFIAANSAGGSAQVCLAVDGTPGMAARLFGNHSTCDVSGSSHIQVGDREPEHDPHTTGSVDIIGDPCPGGGCAVGASIGLAMAPITFSVQFASDPTFSDLSASADTSLTTLSGVDAVFAQDTVRGTGNGRRGDDGLAVNALNTQPLTLGVDWANNGCDLNGNLASTVDGENPVGTCDGDHRTVCTKDSPDCDDPGGPCVFPDHDDEPMSVNVALQGSLMNQPPTATAGADQTVECTSTGGASFTLNGSASDPDQNATLASWRAGSRSGPEVGQTLVSQQSLGVGAQQTYVLRVIDTFAQADEDVTHVAVVDTTPPNLSVTVSPAVLSPPNHKLVPITVTIVATDTCDANPVVRLVSIMSNEADNGLGDGDQPNDIQGAAFGTDDRQFQLRRERSGNGSGRIYTITYSATDASGNTTVGQATVTVPH
jgi:hypothetical protein